MIQHSAVPKWRAKQKLKLAAKNLKAKVAWKARRAKGAVPNERFHGVPITAAAAAGVDIMRLQHASQDTEGALVGCLPTLLPTVQLVSNLLFCSVQPSGAARNRDKLLARSAGADQPRSADADDGEHPQPEGEDPKGALVGAAGAEQPRSVGVDHVQMTTPEGEHPEGTPVGSLRPLLPARQVFCCFGKILRKVPFCVARKVAGGHGL